MDNNKKFYGINNETWGHKWEYSDSGFIVNKDRSVTFTGKKVPYLWEEASKLHSVR